MLGANPGAPPGIFLPGSPEGTPLLDYAPGLNSFMWISRVTDSGAL